LAGTNFSNADLKGADLEQSVTPPIPRNVSEQAFGGVLTFAHARLDDVCFAGAELAGADFTGADIVGADFHDADVTGARFAHADVALASFAGARGAPAGAGSASLNVCPGKKHQRSSH
jgi:uncharacterized protein YjbI with pentapeptide repeats